jgi:hypothetical protein
MAETSQASVLKDLDSQEKMIQTLREWQNSINIVKQSLIREIEELNEAKTVYANFLSESGQWNGEVRFKATGEAEITVAKDMLHYYEERIELAERYLMKHTGQLGNIELLIKDCTKRIEKLVTSFHKI